MFEPVSEQHDIVVIVGSGKSATRFEKPLESAKVIAVNDAIDITGNDTDYWFTLDPSTRNLEIMRKKEYACKYYAAVPEDYGTGSARSPLMRVKPLRHVHYLQREQDDRNVLSMKLGLSENPSTIHTGNSLYGALGLAYHMGAKLVYIYGLDGGKDTTRFNGLKSKNLDHLDELFTSAVPQIKERGMVVLNMNPKSAVNVFVKATTPENMMKDLVEKVKQRI